MEFVTKCIFMQALTAYKARKSKLMFQYDVIKFFYINVNIIHFNTEISNFSYVKTKPHGFINEAASKVCFFYADFHSMKHHELKMSHVGTGKPRVSNFSTAFGRGR